MICNPIDPTQDTSPVHILEKKKKPNRGIQEFTTKVSAFPLVILKQKKKRTGHTQEQKRIYKVELSTLLKKYRVNGETFYHHAGRYANQPVEKRKLVQEILEMGAELEEVEPIIELLKQKCIERQKFSDQSFDEIEQVIHSFHYVIDKFQIVLNKNNPEQKLIYLIEGTRAKLLASSLPGTDELVRLLANIYPEDMALLHKEIQLRTEKKKRHHVTMESCIKLLVNSIINALYTKTPMPIDYDIKPLTLSNSSEFSAHKLNYEYKETPQLNPHLKELLGRITDSDRLCALLWICFNGHKSPYVIYLYGEGGEGKSSFTGMLRRKIGKDVVASFDSSNQFSNFGMFNKALIVLSENNNPRVLQKAEVKQLTGDSIVSIEQKGKDRFTGTLSGLLIIDSNVLPEIDGDSYELRRLRLFKFEPLQATEFYSKEMYESFLGENFNDFLNYCRICYENIGQNWTVLPSPNQQAQFKSLQDKAQLVMNQELWAKLIRSGEFAIDPRSEIEESTFYKALQNITNLKEFKKNYGLSNFLKYLKHEHAIKSEHGRIYGLKAVDKKGVYYDPYHTN